MTAFHSPRTLGVFSATLLLLMACADRRESRGAASAGVATSSAPPTATPLPAGLTAVAAAQLDSGNVAFRLKQYPQAQAYYEHASATVPNHPAPWYGIYMVASAMGNVPLADSALRMVGTRSGGGELLQQGVSLQHGQVGQGGGEAEAPPATAAASGIARSRPLVSRHPVLGARR